MDLFRFIIIQKFCDGTLTVLISILGGFLITL